MATTITGRKYEVTGDIRALITKKLDKIVDKLFDDVIEVRVVLQVQKYRNLCEILITGKEHDVKAAQESGESMQDAINLALDHVKRQAQKNRSTIRDHHRKAGSLNKATANLVTQWSVQVLEPGKLRQSGPKRLPRIIKTNNLAILPMTIEDAAESLDGSKNEFIVFRDLDTDRISVMYKRRDNNLGLIAPEV
ncbi:MAG TPA: ribosome-associated translation inhibitor RaiA [Thermoanaerobaculia bacterium]|jgi:putative sigma-54 modulation protein|nr:ribosome-associated translation inhibitor RaiA [Thermoanaerobaculia bacterium]